MKYVRKQNPVFAFKWDGKDLSFFSENNLTHGWDRTADAIGGIIVNSPKFKGKINPGDWVVDGEAYLSVYSEKEFNTLYDECESDEEE